MGRKTIFFIDPMSGGHNLAIYDYELLSRMDEGSIIFYGSNQYSYLPIPNIRYFPIFRYGTKRSSFGKSFSYIGAMIVVLCQAILHRPRAIHFQWVKIPSFDFGIYWICQQLLGVRLIYTVHNLLPHNNHSYKAFRQYNRLYRLCDTLIVHTETSKQELSEKFGLLQKKILVMPHGPIASNNISTQEIKDTIATLKEKHHLSGKIVFSLLGTQSPYKGTDTLLYTWLNSPKLLSQENVVLLVAGSFSKIAIPDVANSNIIIIPRLLTNPEFVALLKITDVLLFPYREISQSGVLLSSIVEHIPYCATRVGELCRPIEMADIGWIIEDTSTSTIETLLLRILSNPEEIEIKKRNDFGWASVYEYYSWDKSAYELKRLYWDSDYC